MGFFLVIIFLQGGGGVGKIGGVLVRNGFFFVKPSYPMGFFW